MTLSNQIFETIESKSHKNRSAYSISVTSGKGGVGKTVCIVNIAIAASNRGMRVLLIDGDFGLANVDIVLGLTSEYTLDDVIDGFVEIEDVMIDGPDGIKILPSASGIGQLESLNMTRRHCLMSSFSRLSHAFDLILIDTGAGIGENVLHLNSIADSRLVVTTPDPHALTDAYSLMKVINAQRNIQDFDLIVNMVGTEREAKNAANRIISTAITHTKLNISYKGHVPKDHHFQELVRNQKIGSKEAFSTLAGQALNNISDHYNYKQIETGPRKERAFWDQYLSTASPNESFAHGKQNQF